MIPGAVCQRSQEYEDLAAKGDKSREGIVTARSFRINPKKSL